MSYVLLVVGLLLLVKCADLLVDGASSIAKKFDISDLVVGLTVVAFGTSMPELVVNIMACLDDKPEIAIGNVLGSNIANILLILGMTAIVYPITIQRNTIFSEIPFSIVAILLIGFLANVVLFEESAPSVVSRIEGGILVFFLALFMFYIFIVSKDQNKGDEDVPEDAIVVMPIWKSILFVVLGVLGLFLGGKWVVDGAIVIAKVLGMSESFIGLTVVAVGTSLPELVTSIMAAMKKNSDIAVGNVVGSNIFNIFFILGVSALIKPLPFGADSNMDIFMVLVSSILLIVFIPIGKKGKIDRMNGIFFILVYIAYTYYLVMRG